MQGDGAAIVVSGIAILFSGVTPNKGPHGMTPSGKVQGACTISGHTDKSASCHWLAVRSVAPGDAGSSLSQNGSPGYVQVTSDATMSRSKAATPQSDPAPGFIPPGEPGLQPHSSR